MKRTNLIMLLFLLSIAFFSFQCDEKNPNNPEPNEPDLIILFVSTSTSALETGDTLSVTTQVANIGFGASSACKIGFYLSFDTDITTSDYHLGSENVSALATGATGNTVDISANNLTIPDTIIDYYIGAIVDIDEQISESNENNNTNNTAASTLFLLEQTLTEHNSNVELVSFSPDGNYLASSEGSCIKIWRTSDWQCVQTLSGGGIVSLNFSPDGNYLAYGCDRDYRIRIWDTSTWQNVQTLTGPTTTLDNPISFSPDGNYLASGGDDWTLKIWRTSDWQNVQILTTDNNWVFSLSFSPDGNYLASGTLDSKIIIWQTSDWQHVKTSTTPSWEVYSVSFSPDGNYLAYGTIDIGILETSDWFGTRLIKHGSNTTTRSVSFSPDSNYLASAVGSGNTGDMKGIQIWQTSDWQNIQTLELSSSIYSVAFSPDGKYLVSGGGDNTIKIWRKNQSSKFNSGW